MSQEPQTGLTQFQELPKIAATAGEVLAKNKKVLGFAVNKGTTLLDTIEAEGMTPDLFDECMKFLGTAATAKDNMNTLRAPVTQFFSAITKEYTTLENQMDKGKDGTIPYRIHIACNEHVKAEARKAEEKKREIERAAMAKQERIDLGARIEQIVRDKYLSILLPFKTKASTLFNSLTLENADTVAKDLKAIAEAYPQDKFMQIAVEVRSAYMKPEELAGLIFDTKSSLYPELSANFKETMQQHKMLLIDQIPARKAELTDLANASAKEKKRLEEAVKLRQAQAELDEQREALEAQRKQQEAIELNKDVKQAELSFDNDTALAEVQAEQTTPVKQNYVINVKTSVGYQQIAALWFKEFAGKTTIDKMEKKTLGSMKGDLEKLAFNGGERLADSVHLTYETDYKAVVKRN